MGILGNIFKKFGGTKADKNPDIFLSYYLFGLSHEKPIWNWEVWQKCLPILQPIIDLSPETPSIKTEQSIPVTYGKDNQNVSYNKGQVRFGRMVWNEKNNEKWTTKYSSEDKWTFFDTEIAHPSRSNCAKNRTNPDLLITIHNDNLTESDNPTIDQSISIHIGLHLLEGKSLPELEKSVHELSSLLNCKIAGKLKRPSSYKDELLGIGYTDSYWEGTRGVVKSDEVEFSENYKRYGIERISGWT